MLLDILVCWLITDFISGFIHWFEDTYLTPTGLGWLDKTIIEPNIEHHRHPSHILEGGYWQTNGVSVVLALTVGLGLSFVGFYWQLVFIVIVASQLNQIHKWAHNPSPPMVVKFCQNLGILQSLKQHGKHHIKPYDKSYCTLTNWLNPILNKINLWRKLELCGNIVGLTVHRGSQKRSKF